LAEMTWTLAKFGNFSGIFGVLKGVGPSHNYFSKLRGLSAKSLGA
jgi:hypothetical protein